MTPDLSSFASRISDPPTSHEAERDITASGERARMEAQALEAVRRYPGSTANELDAAYGFTDGTIRKRLCELRKKGLVRLGDDRKSRITGKKTQTWYAVESV